MSVQNERASPLSKKETFTRRERLNKPGLWHENARISKWNASWCFICLNSLYLFIPNPCTKCSFVSYVQEDDLFPWTAATALHVYTVNKPISHNISTHQGGLFSFKECRFSEVRCLSWSWLQSFPYDKLCKSLKWLGMIWSELWFIGHIIVNSVVGLYFCWD